MKPTIAVTGATGSTGSQVVAQLLATDWPVRALVRRIDARAERLRRAGAHVVVANLFHAGELASALRGTQRAYYCPPTHPHMIDSAVSFAVAAQEAHLDTLVVLSQWLASPAHPSMLTRQHYLADHIFAAVPGVAHVTVNPGFFAHNYLQTIDFAAQLGVLPNPMGESRNAPPSNADIAAVAVGALCDPDRHNGRTYRPTGPDLLDARDMAAVLGRVLGRSVGVSPMSEFLFAKAMRTSGYDAFMAAQTKTYVAEHRRGTFEHDGPTDHVERVAGRPAETFETTARGYAALPVARRSMAQLARVVAKLALTTIAAGGSPDRVERRHGNPGPSTTRLAIDDPDWLLTHAAHVSGP